MPLTVAHLDFILLFTIIIIIAHLFYAFICVTGRYIYDRLYPEPRWTSNEDKSATIGPRGFNDCPTLHDGLFDRGHHTLQNQRQYISNNQNVEKFFIEILDDSDSDLYVLLVRPFTDSAFQFVVPNEISLLSRHALGPRHPWILTYIVVFNV